MQEGNIITIDGIRYDENISLKTEYLFPNSSVSTLPYNFYTGDAVILDNIIHILGGTNNSYNHYKYENSEWTVGVGLPYSFYSGGCATVYNNEIHILGGNNNSYSHYKWNGSSWTSVSTLPYEFYSGSAVVYNNEIHILGTYSRYQYNNHYKWYGSSWTSVSTLPYDFCYGSALVYNNEIHILGSANSEFTGYNYHYLIETLKYIKL